MNGSQLASPCPTCGARAPIVLRGLDSCCSACGAARFLLAGPNVSFAGKPSRFGGIAASFVGVFVSGLGLSISAGLWFLGHAIAPGSTWSWALSVPVFGLSMLLGLALLVGGAKLRRHGAAREHEVQLQAVRSLVEHRRGPVSAHEISERLELPETEVDALLMELSRLSPSAVTIDVDASGRVVYDFEGEERRFRVLEETAEPEAGGDQPAAGQRREGARRS